MLPLRQSKIPAVVLIGIYKKLDRLDQSKANLGEFCIRHLGITTIKAFKEFYTGYETWRLQNSTTVEKMRQWERDNNRGVYHQESLSSK